MYPKAITKPRIIILLLILVLVMLYIIKPLQHRELQQYRWYYFIFGVLVNVIYFIYSDKRYVIRYVVLSVLIVVYFIYRYILYP